MKESFEQIRDAYRFVDSVARFEIMQQIAAKHNLSVAVLNKSGEEYEGTDSRGNPAVLDDGELYIRVERLNPNDGKDLTEFLDEVDELANQGKEISDGE